MGTVLCNPSLKKKNTAGIKGKIKVKNTTMA